MKNQQIRRQTALNKACRATFILGVMILVTVFLSINVSASTWTNNLNVDLDLYYDFEDVDESISHISNLSINQGAYNFTSNGALIGKSGRFTDDNTLKINSTTLTNLGLYDSTLNLWVYKDDDSALQQIVSIENGIVMNLQGKTDEVLYVSGINDGSSDTDNFLDGEWFMVTLVHNGTSGSIYLNGTLIRTSAKNIGTSNSDVLLGAHSSGSGFDLVGYIDEMSWHNRSLSQAEITQLWNNSYGITYIPPEMISIELISPTNNKNITTIEEFVATLTPGYYNLTNATFNMWYPNGTVFNTTINDSLSGNQPVNVLFNISGIPVDTLMSWNVLGCQESGAEYNCFSAPNNFTVIARKILEESQIYNSQATEGTSQTFRINVSISPGYFLSSGNLIYNGTSYLAGFSETDSMYQFTRTITLPSVTANTNVSFYWDITLTDATKFNSSTNNQTILNLGIDNCSVHTIVIFNFTLANEETQASLNGATDNTSIKVDIDLYSSSTSTIPVIEFYEYYDEINPAGVCISNELNESHYYLDAQIEYNADGYAHEFYHIQKYNLNASSNPSQNITLYDLSDDDAQPFKISYKDESFLAVAGALIQIQRKYIEEGVFKTVEIPKTDSKGETIGQLVLNEVIYSFTIVKEGAILAVFDNVYAVCQNPAITECEINLNSFSSTIEATDFYTSEDFAFTLDYDKSIRTITATFSIPSGAVSTVVLNVTKEDALGTEICSESVTTSAGILTCVVGNNFGNGTVKAKLYSDGVLKGQGQINLAQSPIDIYGASLVFLGLFIMLTLVGAGLSDNPVLTSIFLIVGAILLFALNLVAHRGFIGAGATILWLIIAVILIIIKGSRRT